MIFIVNRFSMTAFGLATAVKEFAAAVPEPRLLARKTDSELLARSTLRPIGLVATLFGRDGVWHLDDMFAPLCIVMASVGLLTGREVIICPHGMLDRWALRNGRARTKRRILGFLNLLARYGRLNVHALNRAEARKARLLLSRARRIEVIPNGIPGDILAQREGFTPRTKRTGPLVIGCMSRIAPKKNQLAMVELAARLRQVRPSLFEGAVFRIDGQVEDADYAARIEENIAAQGLQGKVTVGGAVPFETRAACLSDYDVFFFPSKSEGMPYVVIEAIALGALPLVAHTASCDFVQDFGGKVYRDLSDAAEFLPTDREELRNTCLDIDTFMARFGGDHLRSFLGSFREGRQ
ncbi:MULTISPECIES: glycosyltransferase [unclassified Marinovum]|uniref:glycosyltransferase n=1 Tax=unclassified Marinovum TaxID=2647166 RepID=UPI003EDC9C02